MHHTHARMRKHAMYTMLPHLRYMRIGASAVAASQQKKAFSMDYCLLSLRCAIFGQPLAISLPVRFVALTCWGVLKRSITLTTQITQSPAWVRISKRHHKPSVDTLTHKAAPLSHQLKDLLGDAVRSAYKSLEHDEVYFVMRGV